MLWILGRRGADVKRLLSRPGTVLSELAANVVVLEDPVTSDVSSTKLREQIAAGNSIRYLTPDAVVQYIQGCQLYTGHQQTA